VLRINPPVGRYQGIGFIARIFATNNYVYVADFDGALEIIDGSIPTEPRRRSRLPMSGSPNGITLWGNDAFVAAGNAGLHMVDVSDPLLPALVATYETHTTGVFVLTG
jgi:hypothetical protein